MVSVRWRKALERAGLSQRALAKKLGVNSAELNLVVQGRAFLTPEKFKRACEYLDCVASDIYEGEVIAMMYGMRPSERRARQDTRVRLATDVVEYVDYVASIRRTSRTEAANIIIRNEIAKVGVKEGTISGAAYRETADERHTVFPYTSDWAVENGYD